MLGEGGSDSCRSSAVAKPSAMAAPMNPKTDAIDAVPAAQEAASAAVCRLGSATRHRREIDSTKPTYAVTGAPMVAMRADT